MADLPPECLELLETAIDSLEKLELVSRIAGGEEAGDIAELVAAGIVEAGPPVRLVPRGDVTRLLELYDEDRAAVVSALSAIAVKRIRAMAARTLVFRPKRR